MRDSIIVSVSELRNLVQDIRRTGKQYVQLTISDGDEFDGETIPARLTLCTCDPSQCVQFDEIYAPENEAELRDAMTHAVRMSSNLL